MTATSVGGKKVVAEETPRSPLWTAAKPMYYVNSRELMLEDGSTIFGCAYGECDYTDEKLGRIRAHQGYDCKFRDKPPSRRRGSKTTAEHFTKAVARGEEEFSPDIAELVSFFSGMQSPEQRDLEREKVHRRDVERLEKLVRTWKKRAVEAEAALALIRKSVDALRR